MDAVTHSIEILVTALFSASILWGEHYHPWKQNGERLDVRWNYALGTFAMMFPFSLLLLLWMLYPPENPMAWALLGLWIVIGVSGLSVWIMHEYDAKRSLRERAETAETVEQMQRDEPA